MRLSKFVYALVLISVLFSLSALSAQEADDTDETEERVLDTVTVTGVQNDAAMAAFQAGDYATAEIEFLDNAMCALRRERNFAASVQNAQVNSNRAETFANSAGNNSGATSQGAGAGGATDIPTGIAATNDVTARNVQTKLDRTCEKRGRQLYFAGLSQIQLGKTEEALRSFEKATSASKVLYDAHYKIGLIKLLSGDEKAATTQLSRIETILERCRNCDAKEEILIRRDHLTKALSGEIELR